MGVSTLNKWIKVAQDTEDASLPDADLVREVERLRKENAVLKQEREILNCSRIRKGPSGAFSRRNATAFFAGQKQ